MDKEKEVRPKKKKSRAPLVALILVVGISLRICLGAGIGALIIKYNDDQYKKRRDTKRTERTEEETEEETETEPAETTVDPDADDWTILVYMCGSNLETQSGIASEFIDWMNDEVIADGVNVIVETGGSLVWNNQDPYFSGDSVQNVTIPVDGLGRYKIEQNNVVDLGSVPAASMGSAQTLSEFISWGAQNYPAQKYMFVMWDHGYVEPYGCMEHDEIFYDDGQGGTLNSLTSAVDTYTYYNDCLYLDEVRDGFANGGVHFDLIAFNTCLTASIEIASAVAPYGDYMVASEESIPAAIGIPVGYLSYISSDPSCSGSDVADELLVLYEQMTNDYTNQYSGDISEFFSMGTMSKIDLSCMEEMDQYLSQIWEKLYYSAYDMEQFTAIQTAASNCENYGSEGNAPGNLIDLRSFLVNAAGSFDDTDADENILALIDANVDSVFGAGRHESQGLSMYFPSVTYIQSLRSSYESMLNMQGIAYTDDQITQICIDYVDTAFTGYIDNIDFIDGYYWYAAYMEVRFSNYWSAPSEVASAVQSNLLPGYTTQSTVNAQTSEIEYEIVTDDTGNMTLSITSGADSVMNVEANVVNYMSDDGDGIEMFAYLGATPVDADPSNPDVYSYNWTNEWVRFNDYVVPMFTLETTDDHITYATPAEVNGDWSFLVFSYDRASDTFTFQYGLRADSMGHLANNDMFMLNDGDEISLLFYIQSYTQMPGYEDFVYITTLYDPFIYDSSCGFEFDQLYNSYSSGVIVLMNFLITDSLGNVVETETVEAVYDANGNLISYGINTDYDDRYSNLYSAISE